MVNGSMAGRCNGVLRSSNVTTGFEVEPEPQSDDKNECERRCAVDGKAQYSKCTAESYHHGYHIRQSFHHGGILRRKVRREE